MNTPGAPWERPDWLAEATAWIDERIAHAGLGRARAVVVSHLTQRSAILRAETSTARVYFKAVLPCAGRELALTAWLSREFPDDVPLVIATDETRGWLLTHEARGEPLFVMTEPGCWKASLEAFSRIQCACVTRTAELAGLGCPDRTTSQLARDIDELLIPMLVRPDATGQESLSSAERDAVLAMAPHWKEMCLQPRPGALPRATLDHGDLHPHNVLVTRDGHSMFLDWSAGAVGDPFFSPMTVLGYGLELLPELGPSYEMLRDAYLRPWAAWTSFSALVDAYEDARPLAAVNYAMSIARTPVDAQPNAPRHRLPNRTIALCLRAAIAWTSGRSSPSIALLRMTASEPRALRAQSSRIIGMARSSRRSCKGS